MSSTSDTVLMHILPLLSLTRSMISMQNCSSLKFFISFGERHVAHLGQPKKGERRLYSRCNGIQHNNSGSSPSLAWTLFVIEFHVTFSTPAPNCVCVWRACCVIYYCLHWSDPLNYKVCWITQAYFLQFLTFFTISQNQSVIWKNQWNIEDGTTRNSWSPNH